MYRVAVMLSGKQATVSEIRKKNNFFVTVYSQ
jgi:hypothetical protein